MPSFIQSIKNFYKTFDVTKIEMDKDNSMARIGFGKNSGKKFFRIDFWSKGYRITKK